MRVETLPIDSLGITPFVNSSKVRVSSVQNSRLLVDAKFRGGEIVVKPSCNAPNDFIQVAAFYASAGVIEQDARRDSTFNGINRVGPIYPISENSQKKK